MNLINVGTGGVTGAAVLILVSLGGPKLVGMPSIDISRFLGSVFTGHKWAARFLGSAVLLAIGMQFTLLCHLLWSTGVGADSPRWGLIFGGAQGVMALVIVGLLMPRHPRPWQWRAISEDSLGIFLWLGNVASGLAVVALS